MSECKCTFSQKTVGDGCDICNPAYALQFAKERIADLAAENDRLRAELSDVCKSLEHREAYYAQFELVPKGYVPLTTGEQCAECGWATSQCECAAQTAGEQRCPCINGLCLSETVGLGLNTEIYYCCKHHQTEGGK